MAAGGARRGAGQRPDPNSLRQNGNSEWITLPTEGRAGDPPSWPLGEQSEREAEVWADWWTLPQAVIWERNDMRYEVAAAVRCLKKVEHPRCNANDHAQFRQYLDSLGLTVKGMRANYWRLPETITDAEITPIKEGAQRRSSRNRFGVVVNGDG